MIDKIFRSLPSFKGKQRIARALLKDDIKTLQDVSVLGKYKCSFLLPNLKENIGCEIFINGIYEKETVDFLIKHIPANSRLLDIGANIGAISIPVCKVRKDVDAICIEAAPWLFEYLKTNKDKNDLSNMQLLNKAISYVSGEQVKFYTPKGEYGKGSLLPVLTDESAVVETITINDLAEQFSPNKKIGFIKIDVEGYEYFAFLGGAELLKDEDAPNILFEYSDWAEKDFTSSNGKSAQGLLHDYGYRIFLFKDGAIGRELISPLKEGLHLLFATKKPVLK